MGTLKVNKFKVYLVSNGIKQHKLSEYSGLGVTTLHHLINEGKGTQKTISIVSDCLNNYYGKKITPEEISKMLQE